MNFSILQKDSKKDTVYILDTIDDIKQLADLSKDETSFAKKSAKNGQSTILINQYSRLVIIYCINAKGSESDIFESIRKTGASVQGITNQHKLSELHIVSLSSNMRAAYILAEGITLANYQFLKYYADADKRAYSLNKLTFDKKSITVKELKELQTITEGVAHARTLVNEPLSYLTAEQLAKEIATIGKQAGFKVTTFNKARIVKEKMGGILAVNRGSLRPPTFTIMEHKPKKALNKQPIVLVGKGVVYDTGGLSLKPTKASMDRMKSDMGGSAVVIGTMYAIAKLNLPLHVVALVPATDNRPGQDAYVPGDVITMYDGTTVEVLNTDAEGRLLLADALHYAKRYKPELVVDFATLTGSASLALGPHGIVCMGTADDNTKDMLKQAGDRQYERLVEFPLWQEYADMLKSDIADMKNVGDREGGAMSAGKFLQHFTDYSWMHFDIAGVSFNTSKRGYLPSGATAYGIRMLMDYLTQYGK